ncbi:hypothetical protein B0H13DRAFT_1448933, partial [Mycena leptocephala]
VQPLHDPARAAYVIVPTAPLGNVSTQPAGLGAKALLAKNIAQNLHASRFAPPYGNLTLSNPAYISPTDNIMTPCTQKLSGAKKKHFTK